MTTEPFNYQKYIIERLDLEKEEFLNYNSMVGFTGKIETESFYLNYYNVFRTKGIEYAVDPYHHGLFNKEMLLKLVLGSISSEYQFYQRRCVLPELQIIVTSEEEENNELNNPLEITDSLEKKPETKVVKKHVSELSMIQINILFRIYIREAICIYNDSINLDKFLIQRIRKWQKLYKEVREQIEFNKLIYKH